MRGLVLGEGRQSQARQSKFASSGSSAQLASRASQSVSLLFMVHSNSFRPSKKNFDVKLAHMLFDDFERRFGEMGRWKRRDTMSYSSREAIDSLHKLLMLEAIGKGHGANKVETRGYIVHRVVRNCMGSGFPSTGSSWMPDCQTRTR